MALSDYKNNAELTQLFVLKPYMDVHMNANLRNDYNNFRKKDKKPSENNFMNNSGGIGQGYGVPSRFNQMPQIPQFVVGNTPPFGFNPQLGLGLNPINPMMTKMPPIPPNFRPLWYLSLKTSKLPKIIKNMQKSIINKFGMRKII